MKPCTMLREWTIEDTNFDGESRKMMTHPVGCRSCRSFDNCVCMVRYAFTMEQLEKAVRSV